MYIGYYPLNLAAVGGGIYPPYPAFFIDQQHGFGVQKVTVVALQAWFFFGEV